MVRDIMKIMQTENGVLNMNKLTKLIREDMKPALGVTEPGAIAFAVASAKVHVQGEIKRVRVSLNSGMYKNAYTCGIPNSTRFGNLYAAALGAAAADAGRGLESLAEITPEDDERAARLADGGAVEVVMDHIGSDITIDAEVETEEGCCTVHIRDSHTNIVSIEKNGIQIYEGADGQPDAENIADRYAGGEDAAGGDIPLIHQYSLNDILEYVRDVPEEEIDFIRDAFAMNMELLEEGMASERTVITKSLLKENGGSVISSDALRTAQLLCNGAIEARVLGLGRPAMSITGSGAHGIIATMPLLAWYKTEGCQGSRFGRQAERGCNTADESVLLRAAALSFLITMYIKEYSGRLSAFCGCGIAAGTGMACGLALMRGADASAVGRVIQNMASGLTGMICDGGNHGCAMKGIVAVDAAFRAADLAMDGVCIGNIHGINGRTPEDTMRHMGMIASPGMVETEKTIVEIMEQK